MSLYWKTRSSLPYYAVVQGLLDDLGPRGVIVDVGCLDVPTATWGAFSSRYAIDSMRTPHFAGVAGIRGTWPDCRDQLPANVDVVTCLQVIEHVEDPAAFARSLFDVARVAVIISVPWLWPAGACEYHRHDPVDAAKLASWTGRRQPDLLHVTHGKSPRAVALYRIPEKA